MSPKSDSTFKKGADPNQERKKQLKHLKHDGLPQGTSTGRYLLGGYPHKALPGITLLVRWLPSYSILAFFHPCGLGVKKYLRRTKAIIRSVGRAFLLWVHAAPQI